MRVKELLATTDTYVNVYKGNEKGYFLFWSSDEDIPRPMTKEYVEELEIAKFETETLENGRTYLKVIATEPTKKIKVFVEEHLCKEIVIEVPEYETDEFDYAEQIAKQMYKNEEIILTADDYNGERLMMLKDEYGHETGWFSF